MLRSQSPMKRTIALLIEFLGYLKLREDSNPGGKVTMREVVTDIQAIFSSAHLCKKMALDLKLIRGFWLEGPHHTKCYEITARGKAFIEKAKSEGLYPAWSSELKRYNIELQQAQETPNPN